MRYRGLAIGSAVVAILVVALGLGAQAAPAAQAADQPATRKATPAKKRTSAAQVRPKKPATASPTASNPSESAARPIAPVEAQPAVAPAQPDEPLPAASESVAASQPVIALTPVQPVPVVEAQPVELPPVVSPPPAVVSTPARKISLGQAMVLGVVEGLTEYLPVSSTGHLILAGYWMGLTRETDEPGVFGGHKLEKAPAIDAYEIVIQLGAILAVLGLYRKRVGQMVRGLLGRNEQGLRLALLLLVAFLPAAVVGLALHKKIEEHLFGPMPVVVALAAGGVLMIVVEHLFWSRRRARAREATQTRALMPVGAARANSTGPMVNLHMAASSTSRFTRLDTMLFWQAAAIGAAQCVSLWPGTSRSMVTILAALVVGLDMAAAAEFSFLLALPTLGAATLYSGMKHWDELMASAGPAGLLVGLIVSGIVAAVAVKAFVHWLTRRGLLPFGVYRIVIALILMLYFLW